MDAFAFLQASPLLRGFTEDGVRIIQAVVTPRQLPAGTPVFTEESSGDSAYLLSHGELSVHVTRDGVEREIGALQAPDSFGELALVQPGPRRATVRARTQALVLEIARRDFLRLQAQRPQACMKLLMNIQESFAHRSVAAGATLKRLVDVVH